MDDLFNQMDSKDQIFIRQAVEYKRIAEQIHLVSISVLS